MPLGSYSMDVDWSRFSLLVAERMAELSESSSEMFDIIEHVEPGSCRVERLDGGWLAIWVGYDPVVNLGCVHISALGRDATHGAILN